MDFNTARFNMVQQQIRSWGVLNPVILNLLSTIQREAFVPPSYRSFAFNDMFVPIGYEQVMLPPKIVGRILQVLQLKNSETVLEIGSGTGYMTALLSQLAKKVISIEIIPELANTANQNLTEQHLNNIVLETGDGVNGWIKYAPYDAIVLTGSVPFLPKALRKQLKTQGRLFAVVGKAPAMSAMVLMQVEPERWTKETLFETDIPPLINAPKPTRFEF